MAFSEVAAHAIVETAKKTAELSKKAAEIAAKSSADVAAKAMLGGEKESGWASAEYVKSAVQETRQDISREVKTAETANSEAECLPAEIGSPGEAEQLPAEINSVQYETDVNGITYKIDGELLPDVSYECNGFTYQTDEFARKTTWDGEPKYTPDAERDFDAQVESGGTDRLPGDDGGHLVARITGGSPGEENLVPMRHTINAGDYKRAENEIVSALKNGEKVSESGKLYYEGLSSRPYKIEMNYSYEGVDKQLIVDNVEGSQELLHEVSAIITEVDYYSLETELQDIVDDGGKVSVTSVLKSFDMNGEIQTITVGFRDEIAGEKSYRVFCVPQEVEA